MQISMGKAEEGLKVLLKLLPNSFNNTRRLGFLRRAFDKQSMMEVTTSFVQVDTQKISTPIANTDINCSDIYWSCQCYSSRNSWWRGIENCSIFSMFSMLSYVLTGNAHSVWLQDSSDSIDNSEFLSVLDEIALGLRRNETISSSDGSIGLCTLNKLTYFR